MVEPVKSILLVDLDGLGRSLAASGGEGMNQRLAGRIEDWTGAIESGELIEPAGTLRTISERRCYVGSTSADEARTAFLSAGFDMVECDGQAQVELSLAVDAMEIAAGTDDPLDFILLTAAPDLTPLVERMRARGHHVAIYVSQVTAAAYDAAADESVPANEFVAFLSENKVPQAAAISPTDRARIEGFAREVHAATNIPMFSPRTFAELFRILAAEVAENGYHFNDTAKAVAERLNEAGRNVTSRQVVFVVKGLALKGHVFSTSDTAERLAEVFREQARYLIGGAGIALDGYRQALLDAWIAAPRAKPAPQSAPPVVDEPAATRRPDKPAATKPAPARRPERPAAAKPAAPPRVPERPKSAALSAKAQPPPQEPPTPTRPAADLKATIAARIAASAKMKPAAQPLQRTDTAPPVAPRKPAAPAATPQEGSDAIELSILAAIAEAVDVLVEDGGTDAADIRPPAPKRDTRQTAPRREPAERPPAREPPPPKEADVEAEAEEGGDIGDEIQRIVASYNRNRNDDDRR